MIQKKYQKYLTIYIMYLLFNYILLIRLCVLWSDSKLTNLNFATPLEFKTLGTGRIRSNLTISCSYSRFALNTKFSTISVPSTYVLVLFKYSNTRKWCSNIRDPRYLKNKIEYSILNSNIWFSYPMFLPFSLLLVKQLLYLR